MRWTWMLLLGALVAVAGPVAADEGAAPKSDPQAAFTQADTNKDGRIDRGEFEDRIVDIFYFADKNKDGVLDESEVRVLVFSDDFKVDDKDQDSKVTLREFERVRTRDFDRADTDEDGALSLGEVVETYEAKGAHK
jgi:Ca2+-binding EF-hand superfamily protein